MASCSRKLPTVKFPYVSKFHYYLLGPVKLSPLVRNIISKTTNPPPLRLLKCNLKSKSMFAGCKRLDKQSGTINTVTRHLGALQDIYLK